MFAFAALFAERFLDARANSPKLAKVLFGIAAVGWMASRMLSPE